MFRFHVITLFPELFDTFRQFGLVSRGIKSGLLDVTTSHLRDFAINTHGQVDDTPFGGGSGMVMRPEPAVAAIRKAKSEMPNAKVVLMTPRGRVFDQQTARELAKDSAEGGLVFLSPRYEGVDERIAEQHVDLELCVGDFIVMGGETPVMAVIEAVARLVPGVLGNPDSPTNESFETGMLEHPQYTKPQAFEGLDVPEVLISGHHEKINSWRKAAALKDTLARRPDLIETSTPITCELSVALIHHPVVDKQGEIITSSITNLDLHDISRSAKTYGITRYYVVHPVKALRRLADRICQHWQSGYGFTYNHNRSEALELISLVRDFNDVLMDIELRTGKLPKIITTSAKKSEKAMTFEQIRALLHTSTEPHLMLLGTGWGLAPEILARADYHLEPIDGPTDYNHLSVRAAAAIMFDRLLG